MRVYLTLALLIATALSSEYVFDYTNSGSDWSDASWVCASGTSQSPIDLPALTDIDTSADLTSSIEVEQTYTGTSDVTATDNGHSVQMD